MEEHTATYLSWADIRRSYERDGKATHSLLQKALDEAKGERDIVRFIKQHPHIVAFSEFWWGHNDLHVFFEFKLGAERAVDILVLGCHSGGWCPTFIEVQDPNAELFLTNGDPGPQLREGVRQNTQWRDFIHRNPDGFRQELARRIPENVTAYSKDHKLARSEVLDPREYFDFRWWVLCGRSSKMSREDLADRRLYTSSLNGINIATFDRLLKEWERDFDPPADASPPPS